MPDSGVLQRYLETFGIIVPAKRTNEVTNPSVEVSATGYTSGSGTLSRTSENQYHGCYSLKYIPTSAAADGFHYYGVVMSTGQTRVVSCKFLGAKGVPYSLGVSSSGGTVLASRNFMGTGLWQWVWVVYTATASATRRITFSKAGSPSTAPFYVDGVQSELCGPEGVFVTTYIDGDQQGNSPNQYPAAYLWLGTPHNSQSYRSPHTRTGGRVVKLFDFGFMITLILGLGMAPVRHQITDFSQLDGGQYQNTYKQSRQFSLAGRWQGTSPANLEAMQAAMGELLDRDVTSIRQPLTLVAQATDGRYPCGDMVTIPKAVYSSGLEGNIHNGVSASSTITFTQNLPFVQGKDGGTSIPLQQTLTNVTLIAQRSADGTWSTMGSGNTGTIIYDIDLAPDGSVYAVGLFTNMGGVAVNNIAKWNGSVWAPVGPLGTFNGVIYKAVFGPDGTLYVGGNFTDAGGNVNSDYVAKWDGTSWLPLGTGANALVYALHVDMYGNVWAGGDFTTIGGVSTQVAKWTGSAWVGTGAGVNIVSSSKQAITSDSRGIIYIGGASGTSTKVAKWDGTSWTAVGAELSGPVQALYIDEAGVLYAGGQFYLTHNVNAFGIAYWSGTRWESLGGGVKLVGSLTVPIVSSIQRVGDGSFVVSGTFNQAGDLPLPEPIARWNGTWSSFDFDSPGRGSVSLITPDQRVFMSVMDPGNIQTGSSVSVTNDGTVDTYPTVIIRGPSTGSVRLYSLTNFTTRKALYFDLVISAGEIVTLVLDPQKTSFTSSFRGNIWNSIQSGSQTSFFALKPGTNKISIFGSSSTVSASIQWPVRYGALSDALQQTRTSP